MNLFFILETIFPPVFGKRLKAQVAKKGDRVVMEVEITGIPEPTVSWYKNDVPIIERPPELRIIQQGNCYTLHINKGMSNCRVVEFLSAILFLFYIFI